jgi:hypothetical protein
MPSTIRRSPAKAQRTWGKVHDAAAKGRGRTLGGVDYYGSSKRELYQRTRGKEDHNP